MSEIKLFSLEGGQATEIIGSAAGLEKSLQILFESNLDTLLGMRFVKTEHTTGHLHKGRIDSLAIDENGCPVIIEYKRAISEDVVSQGLYYLDWLMDHKADFTLLVMKKFGKELADAIDWSGPRLVCIASEFTKFNEHAIRQINRNIDLVRYKRFGEKLLALELATSVSASASNVTPDEVPSKNDPPNKYKRFVDILSDLTQEQRDQYEHIRSFILALGDDVTEKQTKYYVAFRRIKNFVCACVTMKWGVSLYIQIDPTTVEIDGRFMRDMRDTGHYGTGDLEITVVDKEAMEFAQQMIVRAYEGS